MENKLKRNHFAIVFLTFLLASLASLYSKAEEVGYNMTPVFIETNTAGDGIGLWSVRKEGSEYYVLHSSVDGASSSWTYFTVGTTHIKLPADVTSIPSSIFIHSSGQIFIAEAPVACKSARIFGIDRTSGVVTALRYMDPTATVLPWGWTEDNDHNLFAGFYGYQNYAHPECMPSVGHNISYVIKVAGPTGAPTQSDPNNWDARKASTSSWDWTSGCIPTECYDTEINPHASGTPRSVAFGAWTTSPGVASNLHIHNLRYDTNEAKFIINSGDSPRATMTWDGVLANKPTVIDRIEGVSNGFTGCTSNNSGVYVGDDWTPGTPALPGRGNSIRFMSWSGDPGSRILNTPSTTVIFSLVRTYDTPVWDLHASGNNELWFVNYDEATESSPSIRLSTLQKLTRTSGNNWVVSESSQPNPDIVVENNPYKASPYYYSQSSYRNNQYIAADRYGKIPTNMAYIFLYSLGPIHDFVPDFTVISRIAR